MTERQTLVLGWVVVLVLAAPFVLPWDFPAVLLSRVTSWWRRRAIRKGGVR